MKVFLSIVCLFLAGSSLASEDIETQRAYDWQDPLRCRGTCPSKDPTDSTIFLSHIDCDKYCMCSNGRPTVNICPSGLFFNSKLQTCDYPENADCHYSNLFNAIFEEEEDAFVETVTPTWQNPKTCKGKCPVIDDPLKVALLENKDCTKFCMCHMGKPTVMECDAGLIFDYKLQTCSWPYISKCPQLP